MTRTVQRVLALGLIVAGAVVLLAVAAGRIAAASERVDYEAALERVRTAPEPEERAAPASLPVGEPIGTLEMARIGLTGVVVDRIPTTFQIVPTGKFGLLER